MCNSPFFFCFLNSTRSADLYQKGFLGVRSESGIMLGLGHHRWIQHFIMEQKMQVELQTVFMKKKDYEFRILMQ